MNESGVLTSRDEVRTLVGTRYGPPQEEGTIIGRLDHRNWWSRKGNYALVCNFTTEEGNRISLFAFRRKLPNPEIYTPYVGDLDFSKDVKDGTWWKLTIRQTRTGRLKWYSAELLTDY